MKKKCVSGLGGAVPPPAPLSYGQPSPSPVCKHLRLLSLISLVLSLLLYSPAMGLAAQTTSPAPKASAQPTQAPTPSSASKAPSGLKKAPQTAQASAQASGQKSGHSQTKNRPKKAAAQTPAPHADAWAFSTQKPRPVDSIWTQGMAPQALKKAAVSSLKDKALKNGLTVPEVPPIAPPKSQAEKAPLKHSKGKEMPLAKGMHLRGDMDSISSGWHSSSLKNDLRIDQDMHKQETNVYGAYADIEAGDDVIVSAGPEFSHTRTQNATHSNSHSQTDTGSLGLGLHLKWNF